MSQLLDQPTASSGAASPQRDSFPALTAVDRCDATSTVGLSGGKTGRGSCGAQAFARAAMPSGLDLLFCGHHADQHRDALVAQGATLHTDKSGLNAKPTDPSRSQV